VGGAGAGAAAGGSTAAAGAGAGGDGAGALETTRVREDEQGAVSSGGGERAELGEENKV
jgi:hypothetical protein